MFLNMRVYDIRCSGLKMPLALRSVAEIVSDFQLLRLTTLRLHNNLSYIIANNSWYFKLKISTVYNVYKE